MLRVVKPFDCNVEVRPYTIDETLFPAGWLEVTIDNGSDEIIYDIGPFTNLEAATAGIDTIVTMLRGTVQLMESHYFGSTPNGTNSDEEVHNA